MRRVKTQKGKVTLIFKKTDPYKDFVLKELEFSLKKLKRFFKLPFFPINVCLAYSRKEFDKFIGRKTALWEVGSANCPKNEVYLLSPLIFEKESTHKKGSFPRVLTHELTHLFTYRLYPFYEPHWLREGLAYFIAGQGKPDFRQRVNLLVSNGDFLSRIDTTKSWRENLCNGAYQLSFLWVSFLIKKFGKEKILELPRRINFPYEKVKFGEVFEQLYQQNLNSLQKEFIKNYFSRNSKKRGGENKNDSRI